MPTPVPSPPPPKFGTSGLRGLVSDLTPELVAAHTRAFLRSCPVGTGLFVGRDLRPSSARIAQDVAMAAQAMGLCVTDCGAVPTPALALAAMAAGAAAVMVTGSHIPADRNGLKFYTPAGEITKPDEVAILAALDAAEPLPAPQPGPEIRINATAGPDYVARHVTAFGRQALAGLRLGVYAHSAVGRDLLGETLRALGAQVVELGRSAVFVPVDTEAVDDATCAQLQAWAAAEPLDAILSTDGDGDRPLLTDATGCVIPGDVLGQITAAGLGAEVVVTPVSSNSGAELSQAFGRVIRTRIGSPHVIAAMAGAGASARVAGYEANGGFLLGFDVLGPEVPGTDNLGTDNLAPDILRLAGPLPALMTRDSLLPMIVPLVLARQGGLAALVARQPARFTATGRLQEVASDRTQALIAALQTDAGALARFLGQLRGDQMGGAEPAGPVAMDQTDGLRLWLAPDELAPDKLPGGEIVHLRPSGNAPELRLYTEAATPAAARLLLARGLAVLARDLCDQDDGPA